MCHGYKVIEFINTSLLFSKHITANLLLSLKQPSETGICGFPYLSEASNGGFLLTWPSELP